MKSPELKSKAIMDKIKTELKEVLRLRDNVWIDITSFGEKQETLKGDNRAKNTIEWNHYNGQVEALTKIILWHNEQIGM